MNSYCYNIEEAKKRKYTVTGLKFFNLFFIPSLICLLCGFIALYTNVFIIIYIGMLISVIYIVYTVLHIAKCSKEQLISIIKYNDEALYLIINNNINNSSWWTSVNNVLGKNVIGNVVGINTSIKITYDQMKKYETLSQLMSNEDFLKYIIENPKSKLSNGIEIYKIMNIKNCNIKSSSVSFSFDGFELSNSLLFKGKKIELLNVYNDYDELCTTIKNYKRIDLSTIDINEKKEKKYQLLFEKNYKILRVSFYIFILTTFLNVLLSNLIKIPNITIIIQTIIFCIIAMYYEPSKNTNLNNINISLILKYSIFLFIFNLLFTFLSLY